MRACGNRDLAGHDGILECIVMTERNAQPVRKSLQGEALTLPFPSPRKSRDLAAVQPSRAQWRAIQAGNRVGQNALVEERVADDNLIVQPRLQFAMYIGKHGHVPGHLAGDAVDANVRTCKFTTGIQQLRPCVSDAAIVEIGDADLTNACVGLVGGLDVERAEGLHQTVIQLPFRRARNGQGRGKASTHSFPCRTRAGLALSGK